MAHQYDNEMKDTSSYGRASANTTALLEEELKKLRETNDSMQRTFQAELQQQVQQKEAVLKLRFDQAVKEKAAQSKHPFDSIAVNAAEVKKANELNTTIDDLLSRVKKLSELEVASVGMVPDDGDMPEKTSDGGLLEISRNIKKKCAVQRTRWLQVYKDILTPDYKAIQGLRHRKVKYNSKHKSTVIKKDRMKAKKKECSALKYIDDEAIEANDSDGGVDLS